jgi:V/A-type H+-transporting ATPase subunit F
MRSYVIGNNEMVIGFRLVGIEGVEVTSNEEATNALKQAFNRKDLGLILISEDYSSKIKKEIDGLRATNLYPSIVEIPGSKGVAGGLKMSDLLSKTLGIKL